MGKLLFSIKELFSRDPQNGCLGSNDAEAFYIAPYQRGYKWQSSKNWDGAEQVNTLLRDIYNAWKRNNNSTYYLQFITVKQTMNEGRMVLEVIDGQQRLTTLSILASVLKYAFGLEDFAGDCIDYYAKEMGRSLKMRCLSEFHTSPQGGVALPKEEEITNQTVWFMTLAFKNLTFLVKERFTSPTQNELTDFYRYLCHNTLVMVNLVQENIQSEEWYFDTNLSLQGEELYVYMNSRGEQLSYNENRRAACLALCGSTEEKVVYASRWDNELQNYFWQQRHGNPSADKGFDLFLHTVEMLTMLLGDNGNKMEEKWRDFIVNGQCMERPASVEILQEYFDYRQALKVYTRLTGTDAPIISFFGGEWGNDKSQIDAISIFVSLELLKGQTYFSEELKQNYLNCRLFFRNLYRHASVVSNPQNYIVHFLKLARTLRENSFDIQCLNQVQNPLLTWEEKWRLNLFERRKQHFGAEDAYKTLELLDDISEPMVLRGEAAILFAASFNSNVIDEILTEGCVMISFEELKIKLTQAKNVLCRHFNWDVLAETVRRLLLYGECSIRSGRGTWYPCDLGLNVNNWIDHWHDRMRPRKDEVLKVNEHIVSFLRRDGALPENIQTVNAEFALLQKLAADELAGKKFFEMIQNYFWTEGRFRVLDGWKPEFKGYKSLLWFLSEELRNGCSHDGISLTIDYRRDETGYLWIVISRPAVEGREAPAEGVIPFRQEGDWEQCQLNEIIRTFRETGNVRLISAIQNSPIVKDGRKCNDQM